MLDRLDKCAGKRFRIAVAVQPGQAFLEQGRASTDEDKLSVLGGFAGQAGIPVLSLGPDGLLELQIPLIAYPAVG
jgi:hypothetical protein